MHRALAKFVLEPLDLVMSVSLVLLFSLLWLAWLPRVCKMWRYIFAVGARALALPMGIGLSAQRFTVYVPFVIPYPRVEDVSPDARTWWLTALAVLLGLVATVFFPKRFMPGAYVLRAVLFVQATALGYFLWLPGRFPHTPDSYLQGFVGYGLVLISLVPVLFGLTYYIFDFGLIRKTLLTAMTMIHLCVFIPLQVLLQAVVLQKSVMFMPVLYIVFGLPVDVLMIVAFYSWGMSWRAKTQAQ
jgi:hypothetical protein